MSEVHRQLPFRGEEGAPGSSGGPPGGRGTGLAWQQEGGPPSLLRGPPREAKGGPTNLLLNRSEDEGRRVSARSSADPGGSFRGLAGGPPSPYGRPQPFKGARRYAEGIYTSPPAAESGRKGPLLLLSQLALLLPLVLLPEYRRCQIFLVALATLETAEAQKATGGPPKTPKIEVLVSEDYRRDGEEGQYTHKRIDLAENLPAWILRFVDRSSCCFEEKSLGFVALQSTKFPKAKVSIASNHVSGVCTEENALELSPDKLRLRQIDLIDIVNDGGSQGRGAPDDLRTWKSLKAGFGPLASDWMQNVPLVPLRPARPPRSRPRGGGEGPTKEGLPPLQKKEDPAAAADPGSSTGAEALGRPTEGGPPPNHHEGLSQRPSQLPAADAAGDTAGATMVSASPRPSMGVEEGGGPPGAVGAPSGGPPLEPAYPLMTCYKCFEIDFPYFGLLAGRIEAFVVSSMREQLMQYHKKAIACIDRWYDMSLEEVRKFEDDVRQQLAVLAALSRDAAAGGAPAGGAQTDSRGAPSVDSGGPRGDSRSEAGAAEVDLASVESDGDSEQEGPPRQLLEALEDKRIYTGARLLPLQLSPQSLSLLQRLQQRILADTQSVGSHPVSPHQQQQQQQQEGGPPRPMGSAKMNGEGQEGGPLKQEAPIRHGFLDKLADGYWGSGWNARYFLLKGSRLQYFDDPRDARAKQAFTLTGATADWVEDMKERPYAFYIEAPGRKRLVVSGGTEEESLAWLSAIQSAARIELPSATTTSSSSSSSSSSSTSSCGVSRRAEESAVLSKSPLSFADLPGVGGPLGPPSALDPETPLDLIASFPLSPVTREGPPEAPAQGALPLTGKQGSRGPPHDAAEASAGAREVSSESRAGPPPFGDRESQLRDEALQQHIATLKGPLKEVIAAATRRAPRGRCFRIGGSGGPHAVFLGDRGSGKGAPSAQERAERSLPSTLTERSLWEALKETEGDRCQPSVAEEAAALGVLSVGVLLLLLSAAAVCCCCSSFLSLFGRIIVGPLHALVGGDPFSNLLQVLPPLGGAPGSSGALAWLFEGLRAAAAFAAAVLLLRGALWVLARLSARLCQDGNGGPPSGPSLLKVACVAEGPPTEVLLAAVPSEATSEAAAGPADPSILAAGGPFLLEVSETFRPLELFLDDLGALQCLCWGPLRYCFPRVLAYLGGLFGGPLQQQQQQQVPFLPRSSSRSKLAAANHLMALLLQWLRCIVSLGLCAAGAVLGALLAALSGAPLGPLQLRRTIWCATLEGRGFLLLSLLSLATADGEGGPQGPLSDKASSLGAPARGDLRKLLAKGAHAVLRLGAPYLCGAPLKTGVFGGPCGEPAGVEGLLVTPLPSVSEGPQQMGPRQLQQLQQQQDCSLASLRFGAAPDASSEGTAAGFHPATGALTARAPSYSMSDRGKALAATALKTGALEDLLEGPPPVPHRGGGEEGSGCLVTWVGGPLKGGPSGPPRWLEALLTLRRAEASLESLFLHAGAQRALHEVGPYRPAGLFAACWAPQSRSRGPLLGKGSPSLRRHGGRRGASQDLEGPLAEFFQSAGGLEAPEADRLAKRRAQQRWKAQNEPYPLCGWLRGPRGALQQEDSSVLLRQRILLLQLLQRQRAHLPAGDPLPASLLLPIGMLRPASLLMLLPECCAQGPPLLEAAAWGGALERFKATLAFAVSILHRGCWQAPPFAACLGETFQGHFQGPQGHLASSQGGWLVYAEQTAVGPPSTLFCISNGGAPMQIWGHLAFHAAYQQNTCLVFVNGRISVSFRDAETVSFSLPQLIIEGLLWGPRLFSWRGPLVVEGPRHRCTLTVGSTSRSGGPLDELFGRVERIGGPKGQLAEGRGPADDDPQMEGIITGAYTDRLFWNDEVHASVCSGFPVDVSAARSLWSVSAPQPFSLFPVPDEEALPLDSRFRTDCLLLSLGYEETADALRGKTLETEAADEALRGGRGPPLRPLNTQGPFLPQRLPSGGF
ncbi:hypothetical protein Efla_004110 [Eimeria flavescens]